VENTISVSSRIYPVLMPAGNHHRLLTVLRAFDARALAPYKHGPDDKSCMERSIPAEGARNALCRIVGSSTQGLAAVLANAVVARLDGDAGGSLRLKRSSTMIHLKLSGYSRGRCKTHRETDSALVVLVDAGQELAG
jgi:hypothetical protein